MPNDIGKPVDQSLAIVGLPPPVEEGNEIDLRDVLNLLYSNRMVIAGIVLTFALVGVTYLFATPPIFESSGLVQVEEESKSGGVGSTLGNLSSLLLGGTVQTEAEIQILQSRMVLTQVIDKMNLLVSVTPRRFPLVGNLVARKNRSLTKPSSAWFGLRAFAWGGEKIAVTTFQVPDELISQRFKLIATEQGYSLSNDAGVKILDGKVGEVAEARVPEGGISVFVRELEARPNTEFYVVRRSQQSVLAQLSRALLVSEQGKQSGVIRILYRTGAPDVAANVVNNIENAYLLQNVERRSAEAQQSLEFLTKQLPDFKGKVEAAQARLNSYQLQHGTVDVSRETESVLKENVDLETRRLELQQQREEALQRFTPQHPMVKSIDDQLQVIQGALGKVGQNIQKLPTTQQDVLGLMRDLDVATQLYTALLDTIQQLQVAKAGTTGNVRIVDRALKAERPFSPRMEIVLPVSLFLGFFFGFSYVFARRVLMRGIDDPAEVERRFGLMTYASIPYSKAQRRLASQMGRGEKHSFLLASLDTDPLVSEALRSLRTSLHFALIEAGNNVLMITGPTPGLGKSFVSANLAATLAMSGKKVVLLDADLRRGHMHRYFHDEPSPGLTDFLAGDADAKSVVRATSIEGLDYVARGTLPPNPAELLLNENFSKFVASLSARYDHVILDSPPVLPVTDAAIVGRLAGCILMVLKSAEHPVREIEDTIKRLSNARLTIRGVVFNQVGAKVGSYGYGNYGYSYYDYQK